MLPFQPFSYKLQQCVSKAAKNAHLTVKLGCAADFILGFFSPSRPLRLDELSALERVTRKKVILSEMEQINELESGRQFNEEESNTILH